MTKRKPDEMQSIGSDPLHKYFHMMLNMADDDLNLHQYRLLGHYLRCAGHDGSFLEGVRKTATITHMGVDKVKSTRDELVAMGYLRVVEPTEEQAIKGIGAVITVVDRWQENVNRYAKTYTQPGTPPIPNQVQVEPPTYTQPDTGSIPNQVHIEEQQEPKKEKKDKSTPADTDGNAIGAIIKAWIDASEALVLNPYGNKGFRVHAKLIHDAKLTPDDVRDFTLHLRKDKYWAGKIVPISKVSEGIAVWKKSRQPAPAPPPVSDEPAPKPSIYGGYFQPPKGEAAS